MGKPREENVTAYSELPFRFDPPDSSDYSSSLSTGDISIIANSDRSPVSSVGQQSSSSWDSDGSEEVIISHSPIQDQEPETVISATSSEKSTTPEPQKNSLCDNFIGNDKITHGKDTPSERSTTSERPEPQRNSLCNNLTGNDEIGYDQATTSSERSTTPERPESQRNSLCNNLTGKDEIGHDKATTLYERSTTPASPKKSLCDNLLRNCEIGYVEEEESINTPLSTKTRLQNEMFEVTANMMDFFGDNHSRSQSLQSLIEDKKNMLISFIRRDLIVEHWRKMFEPYMEIADPVYVSHVSISNIGIYNTLPPTHRYYLCVLIHETTVLTSEVVCATTTKDIRFAANLKFTKLRREFKILVQFYELKIPTIHRNIFTRCLKLSKSRKNPPQNRFELVAETSATLSTILDRRGEIKVMLDTRSGGGRAFISAKVAGNLKLVPKLFSAFVQFASITFGRRRLLWTAKWCVLDRTELILWNSPTEDDKTRGLRIDLLKMVNLRRASRTDCCHRIERTVVIKPFETCGVYFICASSVEELRNLLWCINLVIHTSIINNDINEEEEDILNMNRLLLDSIDY